MVRLKVVCAEVVPDNVVWFQFHYGTIKRASSETRISGLELFQFHYGTIKSDDMKAAYDGAYLFQFHYGTIKSARKNLPLPRFRISIPLWYD